MFRKLILTTVGLAIYSAEAVAGSCPKEYLKRYEDGRNGKVAEYWVVTVPLGSESSLRNANVVSTYNRISQERSSDFKCTFKDPYVGVSVYNEGRCTNSAGFSWDPTALYSEGSGYTVDSQGSYSTTQCSSSHMCGIFVDKSGNRFIVDEDFKSPIYDIGYSGKYSFHMIKDGTADLQMDAVVLRPLFTAGSKRYITISRETESGFYCTYQGGVAPNI